MVRTVIMTLILLLLWQLSYAFFTHYELMHLLDWQAWHKAVVSLWPNPLVNIMILLAVFIALSLILRLSKLPLLLRSLMLFAVLICLYLLLFAMMPNSDHLAQQMTGLQWGQLVILVVSFSYLLPRERVKQGWFVNS